MEETNLIISSSFLPEEKLFNVNCNFFFVNHEEIIWNQIYEVSKSYKNIFVEERIFNQNIVFFNNLQSIVHKIDNFTKINKDLTNLKIAFLASSDTHAKFMTELSKNFKNIQFLIPSLECKDDGASSFFVSQNINFIQIHYSDIHCRELEEFNPDFIFCSADWTSEFIAVKKIAKTLNIPTVVLQEGPQDWHSVFKQTIRDKEIYKIQKPYQHADILLSQGSVTLKYIRPKFFTITGNPKIKWHDVNKKNKPKVMINLNFTYIETKPKYESFGKEWIELAVRACKEIGLEYFISRHPRDKTEFNDNNILQSNAMSVDQQFNEASIVISRFSSISYEALVHNCESLYFNPHREPMYTFNEELGNAVKVIDNFNQLKNALLEHKKKFPNYFNREIADEYLGRHCNLYGQNLTIGIIQTLNNLSVNGYDKKVLDKIIETHLSNKHSEKLRTIEQKSIMIFSRNSKEHFSGGRYHSFMIAEALSMAGHKVYFVSEFIPIFFKDFYNYKNHQNIEIVLTKDFKTDLPDVIVDYLFVTPGMDNYTAFYENAVFLSQEKKAKMILINFESPNWFNQYSPIQRDFSLWDNWVYLSKYSSCILSISKEGMKYAKDFYLEINQNCIFNFAYPSMNNNLADIAVSKVIAKENRIVMMVRFSHAEHKGSYNIPDLLSDSMHGFTFVLIVGAGEIPKDIYNEIKNKADKHSIILDVKYKLSDYEKFIEMAKAKILLFPSFFEGFGYPPVEAQYLDTKCIAFDLPVLRETSGNNIYYAPRGDWKTFKALISKIIQEDNGINFHDAIKGIATISSLAKKLNIVINNLEEIQCIKNFNDYNRLLKKSNLSVTETNIKIGTNSTLAEKVQTKVNVAVSQNDQSFNSLNVINGIVIRTDIEASNNEKKIASLLKYLFKEDTFLNIKSIWQQKKAGEISLIRFFIRVISNVFLKKFLVKMYIQK